RTQTPRRTPSFSEQNRRRQPSIFPTSSGNSAGSHFNCRSRCRQELVSSPESFESSVFSLVYARRSLLMNSQRWMKS
ncbi:hypothetical protein LINPERHAP2_LOCUS14782, partial [Linum perenne]